LERSTLRPSTTLEVLDRAFRVYRDNFGLVIALVALAMIPLTALNLFNTAYFSQRIQDVNQSLVTDTGSSFAGSSFNNTLFSTVGFTVLLLLVNGLAQCLLVSAPLTYIASERYLGRRVSIGRAYRAVAGRLGYLALSLILFYIIIVVLVTVASVMSFACLAGLGLVGFIMFVGINYYAFMVPVFVLERTGFGASIGRAWSLAKSRFWALFWLTSAVLTTTGIISIALYATQVVVAGGTIGGASARSGQIVNVILSAAINIFVIPVLPLAYTMMYYDTRIRREGLDIALSSVNVAEPRPADVGSPPPGPMLVQQDWRTILTITVVGLVPVALYFCLIFALIGLFLPSKF
jgi:hypothetical protein